LPLLLSLYFKNRGVWGAASPPKNLPLLINRNSKNFITQRIFLKADNKELYFLDELD
jgi:hypothetical protein